MPLFFYSKDGIDKYEYNQDPYFAHKIVSILIKKNKFLKYYKIVDWSIDINYQ